MYPSDVFWYPRKLENGGKSFVWGFSCFIFWWSNSSCRLVEENFLKKSQNYASLLCSHLQIRCAINYLWRYYFMPKYNWYLNLLLQYYCFERVYKYWWSGLEKRPVLYEQVYFLSGQVNCNAYLPSGQRTRYYTINLDEQKVAPGSKKCESCLPKRRAGIQVLFEP